VPYELEARQVDGVWVSEPGVRLPAVVTAADGTIEGRLNNARLQRAIHNDTAVRWLATKNLEARTACEKGAQALALAELERSLLSERLKIRAIELKAEQVDAERLLQATRAACEDEERRQRNDRALDEIESRLARVRLERELLEEELRLQSLRERTGRGNVVGLTPRRDGYG
jgi:hypothetical protein